MDDDEEGGGLLSVMEEVVEEGKTDDKETCRNPPDGVAVLRDGCPRIQSHDESIGSSWPEQCNSDDRQWCQPLFYNSVSS